MVELREFALELINRDRARIGADPVVLGTNLAAQSHAEDMLVHQYFGHWWKDGRKPYMVYSTMGGTSYAFENVATSGWTKAQWEDSGCDRSSLNCTITRPRQGIEQTHDAMVYDDAESNWGHRDNILQVSHRAVSIGIASNDRQVAFVQHFEGGHVLAVERPSISAGVLTLDLKKVTYLDSVFPVIGVFVDPIPTPKTSAEISFLRSYCPGGGFVETCNSDVFARILQPAPPDQYYIDLLSNEIEASIWEETEEGLTVEADLSGLITGDAVYTVAVWADGEDESGEMLLLLTALEVQ